MNLSENYTIFNCGVRLAHYNCIHIPSHHPEDGHASGHNMSITV